MWLGPSEVGSKVCVAPCLAGRHGCWELTARGGRVLSSSAPGALGSAPDLAIWTPPVTRGVRRPGAMLHTQGRSAGGRSRVARVGRLPRGVPDWLRLASAAWGITPAGSGWRRRQPAC
ncbi:hypothetical protein NDU88_005079 [Pleurodeles waltl]|uniref:Uncharacterized protein n=1 Tax=Pleurodeles waltl TaxID=8319 RepID=A0AAV7W9Q5_PLEWA|nr:hypothetical protein NDU88_005079 [Pleurodeles waltl]